VTEVIEPVEIWKGKALQHKVRADKLEAELNKIKKKLIEITTPQ